MNTCARFAKTLAAGDRVFQLAVGEYMRTYITPTYNPWKGVVAEWHDRCFRTSFEFQEQPYFCVICGDPVEDGEDVMYITCGRKPIPPYMRLESRGYHLPLIAHCGCWEEALQSASAD